MSRDGRKNAAPRERLPLAVWAAFIFVVVGLLVLPMLGEPRASLLATSATQRSEITPILVAHVGPAFVPVRDPLLHGIDGERPTLVKQWQVVLAAARAQVGGRYAHIGDTPQTGFSCVGLVKWSFANAGISVPEDEVALAQAFPQVRGAKLTGAGLLPGDILLFHDTGPRGLSHAAVYAGDGEMVSADSPANGVREEPIDQPFWVAHWALAVRVPGLLRYTPAPGA